MQNLIFRDISTSHLNYTSFFSISPLFFYTSSVVELFASLKETKLNILL